jgi:hypothetical protein
MLKMISSSTFGSPSEVDLDSLTLPNGVRCASFKERTFALHQAMSALPPKADIGT